MIWTLILSFNSSVWLHLTLYIAWEQSNIPQYSSMLACWDTLHLPAAIQGGQRDELRPKNPTLQHLPSCICGSQSLIFLGGCRKWGRSFQAGSFHSQMFSPTAQIPVGIFGVGICWRRKDLLCFAEGVRWCWVVFGYFQDLHHLLSQSISYSCLWSPDQATLGGNSWSED